MATLLRSRLLKPHPSLSLFSPYRIGALELPNRVVMASMTRGRARNADLAPTELQAQYYRQRASAGLIFSEGTWVSARGIGAVHVPGLFSPRQVAGWRLVTQAVHAAGGRIFAQLGHAGAVSHPDFFGGEAPWAPSAINPNLQAFTAAGLRPTVTPRAMTTEDIHATIEDYAAAACHAIDAGFDGVELHASMTYLMAEFLNSSFNLRKDSYGGSAENRVRLIVEVMDTLIDAWGPWRVGIKIHPTVQMGDFAPNEQTRETYDVLIEQLNGRALSHLQVVRARADLTNTPAHIMQDTIAYFRQRYRGTLIANGGFDQASANALLEQGGADLVSFATPFIGNPDLVHRFRHGLALASSDAKTYYQGDTTGYIDYPYADA